MRVALWMESLSETARKDELDALEQADAVEAALRRAGHDTTRIPFEIDLVALRAWRPDVVWNLVEAVRGRARWVHLPALLLEQAGGLALTGNPSDALYLTTDKVVAKRLMRDAGIPTPALWSAQGENAAARYIVKSVHEDASLGLDDGSVVAVDGVNQALLGRRASLGGEAFAEAYIHGRELNVSILQTEAGPRVLPLAEIEFRDFAADRPHIVGYAAKWNEADPDYANTPRTFDVQGVDVARLEAISLACWKLFHMAGYGRVDFRIDAEGRPYVLEVNANPCISPDAGFPAASSRAGYDYDAMTAAILRAASNGEHR